MFGWLKNILGSAKSNPTTSGAGTLAMLAMLFSTLNAQFDGDPTTIPSWEEFIAFLFLWVGTLGAKDGAKPGPETA